MKNIKIINQKQKIDSSNIDDAKRLMLAKIKLWVKIAAASAILIILANAMTIIIIKLLA